jgi:TPR repeat protein
MRLWLVVKTQQRSQLAHYKTFTMGFLPMKRLILSLSIIFFGSGMYAAQVSSSALASGAMAVVAAQSDYNEACPVFDRTPEGDRACLYWQMACKGDVEAQFRLACCYDAGKGVVCDEVRAYQWFEKASACGDISALLAVAACHWLGIGVSVNVAYAIKQFGLIDLMFQQQQQKKTKKSPGEIQRLMPACFALERIYDQLAKEEKDPRRAGLYHKFAGDYRCAGLAGLKPSPSYVGFWEREPFLFWCIREEKEPVAIVVQDEALLQLAMLPDGGMDLTSFCGFFVPFQ